MVLLLNTGQGAGYLGSPDIRARTEAFQISISMDSTENIGLVIKET